MADNNRNPNNNNKNNDQEPGGPNMSTLARSWFWIVLIVVILFGSRLLFERPSDTADMIGLNEVAQMVEAGSVRTVTVQGDSVTLVLTDGTEMRTRKGVGREPGEHAASAGRPGRAIELIADRSGKCAQ